MASDHGGARKGSGRKPENPGRGPKRTRSVSLYEDTWSLIESRGSNVSRVIQDMFDSSTRQPARKATEIKQEVVKRTLRKNPYS